MSIQRTDFARDIKDFRFKELFNELGWDSVRRTETVAVDDQIYQLEAVAEKRDFLIFVCNPANGKMADAAARKKIDRAITKLFFEHLIIFVDGDRRSQIWQLSIREPNKPIVTRETTYYTHQQPELLYQKLRGLFFTLEEEDRIALVDVKQRVSESFTANAEKVTKRFYDEFKKEHRKFLEFIEGIGQLVDRDWYASLMLNRLMFIYFIQKKGFLDNNIHYLRDKLKYTQQKRGKNQFYSFYRDFLLVLFHEGLGKPENQREEGIREEIGEIPYLNGGLFDVHEIEKTYHDIKIKDEAFEGIFDFFDQYNWHLDTRIAASGRDINPDVIGYIFEKYINDRAAMGAYYTKEDITEYISKNTIIPFLFEQTKKECANAFREDSTIWKMLRDDPDRYIYGAVKHGVKVGLPEDWQPLSLNERIAAGVPEEIAIGIDTSQPNLLERRKHWNTPAPPEVALPTEIWREVMERRKRYWETREKLEKGEIQDINDFITYNLDIRQFAQDAVEQYEGSDFINAFYKAITKITVLDPTCGSGAFLFAALNILEPLYEACLERMEQFVADADAKGETAKFPQFRKVLADIERHPNLKYYIYKSIILNNLYGVDIMKEAVEIAKLRLFLKLVAEVNDIDQVEPMPDIDYNIRAGNTLVGFATYKELQDAIQGASQGKLDFGGEAEKFREEAEKVGLAFRRFQDAQLLEDQGSPAFRQTKAELQKRLSELNEKLNAYLAKQYGIDPAQKPGAYTQWKSSHQPFHWFAEFYEIVHENSGFDVIIGNPPYVVYSKVCDQYKLLSYATETCNDLYAFAIERSTRIKRKNARVGMIVPISIVSTDGFIPLFNLVSDTFDSNYFSTFSIRPGKLFDGVDKRLCIWISATNNSNNKYFASKYHVWFSGERESLFPKLSFSDLTVELSHNNSLPKIGSNIEKRILTKLKKQPKLIGDYFVKNSNHALFHTRKLRYFVQFLDTPPKIIDEDGKLRITSELKKFFFENQIYRNVALGLYNSNLFYWYYIRYSDCRNVNKREVATFPVNLDSLKPEFRTQLSGLITKLMEDLQANSEMQETNYEKYGKLELQIFAPRLSKPIIDEIDKALAEHYGFSEEELDFIINYDIKYRMGKELGNNED